jgi:hypothetical protein
MRTLILLPAMLLWLAAADAPTLPPPALPLSGGTVLSADNQGIFVYLEVAFPDKQRLWVMGPLCKAAAGDTVDLIEGTYYDRFHSEALGRDFERIVVATRMSLNGKIFRAFSAHDLAPGCDVPKKRDPPAE